MIFNLQIGQIGRLVGTVTLVRKQLVEFSPLDSNLPLVNTREISTRLSCKHSLRKQYFKKISDWSSHLQISWAICDWQIGQPICKLARLPDWTEHIILIYHRTCPAIKDVSLKVKIHCFGCLSYRNFVRIYAHVLLMNALCTRLS